MNGLWTCCRNTSLTTIYGMPTCSPAQTGSDGAPWRFVLPRRSNHPEHQYDPEDTQSKQIARMQHPDLSVVQRQEGDRDLKIGAVRELHRTLSFSPYQANYRIALLLDFEQASEGAFKRPLKTLEEPPGRVVIMVTAESADALLPTIVSRCEVLRLRPMKLEALAAGLQEKHNLPTDKAQLLAHLSNGKPGTAIHLAQHPEILEQRGEVLDALHTLLSGSRTERFSYANNFYRNKPELIDTLTIWLTYWRDVLQQTTHTQIPLTNLDRREEISALAQAMDTPTALQATVVVEECCGICAPISNPAWRLKPCC